MGEKFIRNKTTLKKHSLKYIDFIPWLVVA